jgi:hypothetical protein
LGEKNSFLLFFPFQRFTSIQLSLALALFMLFRIIAQAATITFARVAAVQIADNGHQLAEAAVTAVPYGRNEAWRPNLFRFCRFHC